MSLKKITDEELEALAWLQTDNISKKLNRLLDNEIEGRLIPIKRVEQCHFCAEFSERKYDLIVENGQWELIRHEDKDRYDEEFPRYSICYRCTVDGAFDNQRKIKSYIKKHNLPEDTFERIHGYIIEGVLKDFYGK